MHKKVRKATYIILYLINFDTRSDALIFEAVHKFLAIKGRLVKGLFEEDSSRDVASKARGGDKELAVGLAVSLSVLQTNGCETLATCSIRLIHGQDTAAR